MEKHKTYIRCGRAELYRDQAIVKRFNHTLAEHLFGNQYAVEMLPPAGQRSTAWVKGLPDYQIERNVTKSDEHVLYYLSDGPKQGFVRKELLLLCRQLHSCRLSMPSELAMPVRQCVLAVLSIYLVALAVEHG